LIAGASPLSRIYVAIAGVLARPNLEHRVVCSYGRPLFGSWSCMEAYRFILMDQRVRAVGMARE
jgi:hypothetical protein